MFSDSSEVLKFIKDTDVKFLDIRFTDLPGVQQHFNIPASTVDEEFFTVGQLFDGSSIRGFQSIHESDLQLIPDVSTAYVDPFRTERTLIMVFDIYNPRNGEIYSPRPAPGRQEGREVPRLDRHRRHRVLRPRGRVLHLRRRALRGEAEQELLLEVDSERGRLEHGPRRRGRQPRQQDPVQGRLLPRHPRRPARRPARRHRRSSSSRSASMSSARHHEVGTAGQGEINYKFDTMVHAADDILKFKYIVKNTAHEWGKTATFMPKPLMGDNGSGMHTHQSLWNDGKPLFYDEEGYGGLSDIARWYIGGLLQARARRSLAFTNPTVNSYHRLDPGLRGSRQPGLLGRQPLGLDPHPDHGHQPEGQAHRVPRAGCLGQPVPRVRGAAHGGPRRHQEQDRAARARRQGPLRAPARGGQEHPAGSRLARRGARRPRGRPRLPARGRRVHARTSSRPGSTTSARRSCCRFAQRPHPFEYELYFGV